MLSSPPSSPLLMLYFYACTSIYKKSPKKCQALEDIITELKSCLEPSEMAPEGGRRPLRACGTRLVTHKVATLERVIKRFGAYFTHLINLVKDG